MIIWTMGGKLVMGFLQEYVLKILAPLWENSLGRLGFLSDLGRDGDLSNSFSCEPSFSLFEMSSSFKVGIHPQPSQNVSLGG